MKINGKFETNIIWENYLKVQKALSADKYKSARKALKNLLKVTDSELKIYVEKANNAPDIDLMRQAFGELSSHMKNIPKPYGVYTAYCPMSKQYWMQKGKTINNPYFGNEMLTCGSIQDEKENQDHQGNNILEQGPHNQGGCCGGH